MFRAMTALAMTALNIRRADVQGLERNLYRIRANRGLAVMLGKKVEGSLWRIGNIKICIKGRNLTTSVLRDRGWTVSSILCPEELILSTGTSCSGVPVRQHSSEQNVVLPHGFQFMVFVLLIQYV